MVTVSCLRTTLALTLCGLCFGASLPYREALPGYGYNFPRDHFEHNDFRTEWWYYTGNVTDSQGARFGFELVFFRNAEPSDSANTSRWNPKQLYLSHAALTDVSGKRFRYEERLNREGPGIAGADFSRTRIWNGNWWSQWNGDRQSLHAITPDFRFDLRLAPAKAFVIQGENGVSQKAEGPGRASYYVSFPRLHVEGEIEVGGGRHRVTGTAWMDHEWFTHQLGDDQQGWDWFSIQLENGTELMLFELRRKDGSIDPYSSGTFVSADGRARHLKREDFRLVAGKKEGAYPIEWQISVPSLQLDLRCVATLPNQELKAKHGLGYWEGAVDYTGTQRGVGYLEMTGYVGKVRM